MARRIRRRIRRRKPTPIPLMPPEDVIAGRRPTNPFGYNRPYAFPPAAQRLYQIRDLMLCGDDRPVRVIGSVASKSGKIFDLSGHPIHVVGEPS